MTTVYESFPTLSCFSTNLASELVASEEEARMEDFRQAKSVSEVQLHDARDELLEANKRIHADMGQLRSDMEHQMSALRSDVQQILSMVKS
eukprot:4322494-Prymnesium_polylepis.1